MTFICDKTRHLKASFWGLFKTNFYGHFRKLFLFTKFNFRNFGKKFFLTILKSTCLEFCASNYNYFFEKLGNYFVRIFVRKNKQAERETCQLLSRVAT